MTLEKLELDDADVTAEVGGGEPQSGKRAEQHGFHARRYQVRVARVDGEDDEVEVPPQ